MLAVLSTRYSTRPWRVSSSTRARSSSATIVPALGLGISPRGPAHGLGDRLCASSAVWNGDIKSNQPFGSGRSTHRYQRNLPQHRAHLFCLPSAKTRMRTACRSPWAAIPPPHLLVSMPGVQARPQVKFYGRIKFGVVCLPDQLESVLRLIVSAAFHELGRFLVVFPRFGIFLSYVVLTGNPLPRRTSHAPWEPRSVYHLNSHAPSGAFDHAHSTLDIIGVQVFHLLLSNLPDLLPADSAYLFQATSWRPWKPAAFLSRSVAGGVFSMNRKELS